jgi:hypothetical protein
MAGACALLMGIKALKQSNKNEQKRRVPSTRAYIAFRFWYVMVMEREAIFSEGRNKFIKRKTFVLLEIR